MLSLQVHALRAASLIGSNAAPHSASLVMIPMALVSHEDQAALLSDTQLLTTIHGAGLTNIIFLQPQAVAIEVFPHHAFCSG
jgi:capsular polysaccharide biosynthesis protein